MVKMRNLVKVGNREVKKRYIGNKLIFEDLGDKTEILSGEEIYTDKADDSVVHVEIDGKSYQYGVPTPDYPIEIHSLNDFDVVSSVGKRNLIRNSDFKDGMSNWWGRNGEVVNKDGYTYYEFTGNGDTNIHGTGANSRVLLEPDTEYIYSVDMWAEEEIKINRIAPLHYHIRSISTGKGVAEGGVRQVSDSAVEANKWSRVILQFRTNSTTDGYLQPYIYGFPNGVLGRVKNFKLEKSSTVTPHILSLEDVAEETNHPLIDKINLSLNEPLRSLDDVKDRLFRDSDGLWKIERSVGEEVFENGDKWNNAYYYARETSAVYAISYSNASYMKERGMISLSHVPDDRIGAGADENEGWLQTNPRLRIRLQHVVIGTTQPSVSAFKDWLKKEHDNGTPLTIVYELAEPTIETLDQELQDKLNNLRSFQDSNYIYTLVDKTDILPTVAENLKPTLHATFKSKGWYDYYKKTLLK